MAPQKRPPTVRTTRGLIALVVALSAGCGGGLSPREYCSERVARTCAWFVACGKTTLTEQACVAQLSDQHGCATVTEATSCERGLRYDPGRAESCVRSIPGTPCSAATPGGPACEQICQH